MKCCHPYVVYSSRSHLLVDTWVKMTDFYRVYSYIESFSFGLERWDSSWVKWFMIGNFHKTALAVTKSQNFRRNLRDICFSHFIIKKNFFKPISFLKLIFNWRIIALQNFVVFCQTPTRISHRYIHVLLSLYSWNFSINNEGTFTEMIICL